VSGTAAWNAGPLRRRCVTDKATTRTVHRWEHEAVIERHRERMQDADALMRRRAGLAEHPFGTLKCRAGYRHFLVRGFDKVRGEWSLMALCYNFTRVLNIIGFDTFIAQLARIATQMILRLHSAAAAARRSLRTLLARLAQAITENPTIHSAPLPPGKIMRHSCPASQRNPWLQSLITLRFMRATDEFARRTAIGVRRFSHTTRP